jgi:hypothetical protein
MRKSGRKKNWGLKRDKVKKGSYRHTEKEEEREKEKKRGGGRGDG